MGNVVNAVDEGDEDNEDDDVAYVRFHTTTIANLVILYFATLGLYSLFWFYQHWSVVWENRDRRISPLARTLFPIFFVHQLFKRIDDGARAAGLRPGWKPDSHATTYVVLLLGSQVVGWIHQAHGVRPAEDLKDAVETFVASLNRAQLGALPIDEDR